MLRVLEIAVIVAIVIYGFIKLIEMFSVSKANKRRTHLDKLSEEAKKIKKQKDTILKETQKTKQTIDNINKNLK